MRQPCELRAAALLPVADVIDADDLAALILHWLVAGDIRLTKNHHLAIEGPSLPDVRDDFAVGVENGPNRPPAATGVEHTGGNANVFVSAFHEERRRHPSPVFPADCVDNLESVVDFGGAEIESGSILAADGLLTLELGLPQFCSLGLQTCHRMRNPRVGLRTRSDRHEHERRNEPTDRQQPGKKTLSVHTLTPGRSATPKMRRLSRSVGLRQLLLERSDATLRAA